MRHFLVIVFILSLIFGQTDTTATFTGVSNSITIDATNPSVDWFSPDGGEIYAVSETFAGSWSATDDSFGSNPIQVDFATEIGDYYESVATNMTNSGMDNFSAPATETNYLRIRIRAIDLFGNIGEDYSQGYILIGTGSGSGIDTTVTISQVSQYFITDAENPQLDWLVPNGGETYSQSETITGTWSASDQSFGNNPISVSIIKSIGDTVTSLLDQIANSGSANITLPAIDTWFARLQIVAKDGFGNASIDASDGYFIIGSPPGIGTDTTATFENVTIQTVVDASDPFVDLTTPDGGETYLENSTINVFWSANDESFDSSPIRISMATEIGGFFTEQTGDITNDGFDPIIGPSGQVEYGQFRVVATDTFGNVGMDQSNGYFSIFVSGSGAIQGYISANRDINGTLFLSLWNPGHDPEIDPPDIEKTPIPINLVTSDQYLYSFSNLDPGVGYMVQAFIDAAGSANSGVAFCDLALDLSGLSLPLTVETDLVTQDTDIVLSECPDTDPPAIPTSFLVAAGDHNAQLSWASNTEFDLSGYVIYRGETLNTIAYHDDVFVPDTTYIDPGLVNGQEYFYQITARDGSGNESDTTNVQSVLPNGAPQWVALSDTSFYEDDSLVIDLYNIVTDDSDADETLIFSIPAGNQIYLIYDEINHAIKFIADPDSSDFSEEFTLHVTDPQGASSELILNVIVIPVNDKPVITSAEQITVTEETPFTYDAIGFDIDSPIITYEYDIFPFWTVVNGPSISGIPDDFASDTLFRIIASDGELNDTLVVNMWITYINDPPVIVSQTVVSATEDEYFVYYGQVNDPDNANHEWYFENMPQWMAASGDSIFGIPIQGNGDTSFTCIVTDGEYFDTLEVTVNITPVNDPPVIISENFASATEDEYFIYHGQVDDPDNANHEWIFENIPQWMVAGGDTIYGIPIQGNGDTSFTCIVTDGEYFDTLEVTVNITPVNDPPVIVSEAVASATEDQYFVYHGQVDDPDNANHEWIFENIPQWMAAGGDSIFGTPTEGIGDTSFTCIVSDGEYLDTMVVMVNVTQINDPPIMTSDLNVGATEDEEFSYKIEGYDPEGLGVNWQFVFVPSWVNYISADSLHGIPEEGDLDTTFQINGSDDEHSINWDVAIQVTPINDPPVITSQNTISGNSGQYLVYFASATDPDNSSLSWTYPVLPSWLEANADSIFGTPEPYHTDTLFVIHVSDGDLFDQIEVQVPLNEGNQLPLVHINNIQSEQHKDVNIKTFIEDPDNDQLTWLLEYNTGDGNWNTATILSQIGTPGLDTLTLVWDSWADLPNEYFNQLTVRSVAFDNIGTNYMSTDPFPIDNHVGSASFGIDGSEEVSLTVELPYEIIDPTQDNYNLTITYSVDGIIWESLSMDENTDNISPDNYTGIFHWNSELDLPGMDAIITLAIACQDAWEYGFGDTISIPLDNEFLPTISAVGNSAKHWSDPVQFSVTAEIDATTLESGISVISTQGNYNISATWQTQSQMIQIIPEGGWIAGDGFQVTISNTVSDIFGNPLDGNQNGDPDGVADNIVIDYNVHFVGDYDESGLVDFEDLIYFQQAWWRDPSDPLDDLGPASGLIPHIQVEADTAINFEDLMVFAQMWNWSNEQSGRILARGSEFSDFDILSLDVTYPKRQPGDLDDILNVHISLDSAVVAPGAWSITLHYDIQDVVLQNINSNLDDQWITLKKEDPLTGYVIIQMADLNENQRDMNGKIVTMTFKRLAGEESDIGLFGDIRDRDGYEIAKTYDYHRIETVRPIPSTFALRQNYPNPFNPTTTIEYDLPQDSKVYLVIFDVLGQQVTELVKEEQVAGFHSIIWDGTNALGHQVSAGMYLMSMSTSEFSSVKKLILIK